jgi:CRISPR-associated protein Cas1
MRTKDLHALPKVRDSVSYLYVEHCRIDREAKAIALHDAEGSFQVPCANLTTLMVGPGTSITHAAVQTLADAGTLVLWMGEQGVRFYAQGMAKRARRVTCCAKRGCARTINCVCASCEDFMKCASSKLWTKI